MRRRKFILFLGSTAVWPIAISAQQRERMRRVGVLIGTSQADAQARMLGFRQRLQELGWTEGRNILIDERWGEGDMNRIRSSADDLVELKSDVLLAGSIRVLTVLKKATASIPIVFVATTDPVGQGFVASLARPGANITGFSLFDSSLVGKLLELLKEMAPSVTRAILVGSPENPSYPSYLRAIETAASTLAVQATAARVQSAADFERVISGFARTPNGALVVAPDITVNIHREQIVALAAQHRLPAIYPYRSFTDLGGLMSYGVDLVDLYWRAAGYVDRILRGESPGELPVQAPAKFEFVINRKTAKALDFTIPPTLLARADEVIE